jgi:HSP20 family protein
MLTGWIDLDEAMRTLDVLQRHIVHVFDDRGVPGFGREPGRGRQHSAWPPVNVFETKEAFVYKAEVPSVAEGDVAVHVEDDALVLRGERKSDAPKAYEVHLRERVPIAFTRKLPLPGRVDSAAVTATMKDGILTVTLPKAKETLPRQVVVQAL